MLARLPDGLIKQLARFALSTGLSAALSFGFPVILHEFFSIAENTAGAIGFAAAYVMNLLLIRNFVFESQNSALRDTAYYMVTNGAFRLTEYGAYWAIFTATALPYWLVVLGVLALSAVAKFFVYRIIFSR